MPANAILIVDDNPANLKVARFALESEGYQVSTSGDAEEALLLLREIRPRLILMDIQLPGMDGLELTRHLKADPATRNILIVAVTAYAMKGDRERALQAGCDGYITKPIDPILLPSQVADHLARAGQGRFVDTSKVMPVPAPRHHGANGTSAGGLPGGTPVSPGSNRTILLIEDNPATRRMYRLALETAGYDVIEAQDGATGLDALARRHPDLIIQDLVLPDMDGLDLTRKIRAAPGAATLPILCVSGFLSRLDEARAVNGGFAQVLVKPLDPFQLLDAVKIHLNAPSAFVEPMGAGRLLIVIDDDPLERKLAQVWFSSLGFNVLVADDGQQGLALARTEHPVAVISDVLMPKMDGFTLCLTIRRDPDLAGIPVILTSAAYTEPADHELAKRVGASALVPKASGLEGATRALTAALDAPPPCEPLESVEALEHEHDRRARAQLEHQVLQNTSLRRRSTVQQAQLAVLAGIADAFGRNGLVDGVLGDVLASCLDMAGVSKGALYLMKGDNTLELQHQIGFSEGESLRLRAKFGHADLFADIAKRGRVVAVPSAVMSPDMAQRLMIDAGVTSLLIVPVTAGVKTYGAMLLGARSADVADEEAQAFARVLGGQMGQAVGMAEAFGLLGASEVRYRTLTENANDAICILTQGGLIQEVNRRMTEIFGYPAEYFIGRHIDDLAAPGRAQENAERLRITLAGAIKSPQLYEIQRQNGEVGFVEFSTAGVEVNGQALVFAIGRDVTERLHRARLLALTAAIGLALNKGDSLVVALQGCAEALVTHLGAALGQVWILNEPGAAPELYASAGLDPPGKAPIGQSTIERIAEQHTPYVTDQLLGNPDVSDQEWAQREGIAAFAGYPLVVDGRVIGVMALFARQALTDAVTWALRSVADHIALAVERHRSVQALRASEERTNAALRNADVGVWELDCITGALRGSEVFEAHIGVPPGTFGGTLDAFVACIHPGDRDTVQATIAKAMHSGVEVSAQYRTLRADGGTGWVHGIGRVHLSADKKPVRGVGITMDITGRRTLEEQFQQAQKMEAVGRLAGGVAHDFNNLLTAILGYCELLLPGIGPIDPRRADILGIQKAGMRAAELTRQLLAFSRKQIIEPTLLDLNAVVADIRGMLGRLIGEDVKIRVSLPPGLAQVKADRGQIDQVIMNLAVNARDAMPTGGTLTIETANIELDEHYETTHLDVKAGHYVVLTVTDTGIGMTPEVQARLFEPFFTTKGLGKGTGLGMATVYGIVKRSGGSLAVYSEPGKGTTVKVYFPWADGQPTIAEPPAAIFVPSGETRTVLVVEDEEALRELGRRLLQRLGYTVLVAADAAEARRVFDEQPAIDILLTDVVMPGASGPELTAELIEKRPALKVIYMSGYTEEAIVGHGVLRPGIAFLNKPFTSQTLGQKMREVLGE